MPHLRTRALAQLRGGRAGGARGPTAKLGDQASMVALRVSVIPIFFSKNLRGHRQRRASAGEQGSRSGARLFTQSTSRWNRCRASACEVDTIWGKSISTSCSASSI